MSQLKALRSAVTLSQVAQLLDIKPALLSFNLYKKANAAKYTKFDIPKRYGGTRQICAPLKDLKLIQQRLSLLLQDCAQEIDKAHDRADDDEHPDRITHGFKRKRSIMTNATEHRTRRYVFNVDLKDFFGCINFGRVRGFFIKDKNFSVAPKVATVLAQIACYENKLPQGSPCSPIISNLIGHMLDVHLVRLAASEGCTYTRYADDLTFSTNRAEFPSRMAKHSNDDKHKWLPGDELIRLIKKNHFDVNLAKTRMQYRDSRQEVTGLVVNRKVNVPQRYRHTVRAMVHRLFTTGSFDFEYKSKDAKGLVTINKSSGAVDQLHGMLAFIDQVEFYNKKIHENELPIIPSGPGRERLFRRFLLFSSFYAAEAPIVICEGKTDNVYLVHAIRSLVIVYPQLAKKETDGTINLTARILKYVGNSTGRILGLHGGVGGVINFMNQYNENVSKKFKAPGAAQPVILLIDNDSGSKDVFKAIAKITKKKVVNKEPFIHVTSNLYVVPTPLKAGATESKIEDFFDNATLTTPVDGKLFDAAKDIETSTHYGKTIFAHKVVRENADKIDFSGFEPLLNNLVAAINEHAKKHQLPALAAAKS